MSLDTPARSDEGDPGRGGRPTLPAMRPQPFRRTRRTFLLTSREHGTCGDFSRRCWAAMTALKTPEQITQAKSPIWPADPATFDYQGSTYDVYQVPIEGPLGSLPWWRKGGPKANSSTSQPGSRPDHLAGLLAHARPGVAVRPAMDQLCEVWTLINYPRLLFSTSPSQ